MEQKRNFEKNILPEIEKKIGQHYEKMKRIYNQEDLNKIEEELNALKQSLEISQKRIQ
jgi:hypothetical protein